MSRYRNTFIKKTSIMIRFSLYEFLSYIIPGYLLLWIMKKEIIPSDVFAYLTEGSSDMLNVSTFLGFAIVIGVIFHFVVDKIQTWKVFEKVFRIPPSIVLENSSEHFKNVYKEVKIQMKKKNLNIEQIEEEENYLKYSFDDAYHYLDVKNMNESVLKFQSIYYLLRNTSTVCIFSIISIVVIFISRQFNSSLDISELNWIFLLVLMVFAFATGGIARNLREKYIKRTFYLYYISNAHK